MRSLGQSFLRHRSDGIDVMPVGLGVGCVGWLPAELGKTM